MEQLGWKYQSRVFDLASDSARYLRRYRPFLQNVTYQPFISFFPDLLSPTPTPFTGDAFDGVFPVRNCWEILSEVMIWYDPYHVLPGKNKKISKINVVLTRLRLPTCPCFRCVSLDPCDSLFLSQRLVWFWCHLFDGLMTDRRWNDSPCPRTALKAFDGKARIKGVPDIWHEWQFVSGLNCVVLSFTCILDWILDLYFWSLE